MLFKDRKSYILNFGLILALLGGLFGVVPAVQASTLTVTNTNDSGAGSLRQAITNAVAGDTITFDLSLVGQTITLASNLVISKDLIIDGSGMSPQVTISGGNVAHVEVSISRVVIISDLTIANGYTSGDGGAVKSFGDLTIINSTLRNNHAVGEGGAIDSSKLTLKNSTIYQNQAGSAGGAISIHGNGFHTIINSTVTQNQAVDSGGGIFMHGNLDVEISNSTFAGNNAVEGKEVMLIGNGILSLYNTIFACTPPENNDCYLSFGSGGINSGNSILDFGTLADFGLSELADNGGPTQTMALLPGSSLIDTGDNTICANTPVNNLDQRGITRPQGSHCDIGAYEDQSTVRYVKWNASGANNGSSWVDAYSDLQSALSAAISGDEIWVATGTYKPTSGTDRTISFTLKNGVAIYGGFAGTETLLTQRDLAANVTILSGDIGAVGNNSDNSYHVVIGSNTNNSAILDGFTVTSGNANSNSYASNQSKGGGMYSDPGSPTVMNAIFISNYGTFGGGMYNGGEYSFPSGSGPILTNLTFINNAAIEGGGMRNEDFSNPSLTNVMFSSNTAVRSGGGMENFYYSSPTLTNVTFNNNTAGGGGGGIMNWSSSSPILTNVTFNTNSATDWGGGIYNDNGSNPSVKNVTFNSNQAIEGGGMYNAYGSDPTITNSILYGNTGGDIFDVSGTRVVTYSIVQGGYPGTGNLNADPLLGPLQDNGGFTHTMALLTGSPAIDGGNSTNCPATDQRGVTRPQGSGCDIGAYEYEGPFIPIPTFTPTFTATNTPTKTPTISPTPVTSCDQITAGPITKSGNSMSMAITNPLTLPIQIQDVFVVWDHDKGHQLGFDKTLNLNSVSLDGIIWSGTSNGPSVTIIPSSIAYIPTGTSTITFTFHQSYDNFDGTEEILIHLATNGCQAYPIHSTSIATDTPTPTFTPTNTFTPMATPPYSYNPLYLSLTGNQTIGGVASADEDILRFDGSSWNLFFDGSDVGVGGSDLFGFSFLDADSLLLSFTTALTLNGISVTPQDVVRFDATSLGSVTSGTFSMYFDGSDVGLDTTAEKIDSVGLLTDGRVLLSTTGNPVVVGVTGAKDEDVLAFTPTTLGNTTSGTWSMYFDGSDVGLGETSGEDVDALDVTANGNIYLSTADNFTVNGVSGADEDVFVCMPTSLGEVTACTYSPSLYFDGSTWGLTANDVDAFHFLSTAPIPTNTPSHTPTFTSSPTFTPTRTNTPPTSRFVQIVQPNGGEVLIVGSTYRITWNSTSDIDTVTLGYKSCDSCLDWIATGIPNVGYYDWNVFVGNTINTQFKIYILGYDTGVGSWSDVSDNNFTVLRPTATPNITHTPTATLTPTPTHTYTPTIIPSITSTPGVPNLIFKDGFESGDLSAWTSSTIDLGDLSASAVSALVGNQGMQAVIDDNNTIYVTDDSPNTESTYRARFYFDPNSIPMLSGDAHFIFKGFMGTSTEVLRTEFRQTSGVYQLRMSLLDDGTTWVNSNWFTISDASHFIEMDWHAGTGMGANNGSLTFWIDGILQASLTGVDNDTRRIDRVRLGALTGIDNDTRGTYYFDAFESHRQTYIGP